VDTGGIAEPFEHYLGHGDNDALIDRRRRSVIEVDSLHSSQAFNSP
jgi:hypothetical protein